MEGFAFQFNVTFATSRKNGYGGHTAISILEGSTPFVNSWSSEARTIADFRSVFIFQFPAIKGRRSAMNKKFFLINGKFRNLNAATFNADARRQDNKTTTFMMMFAVCCC